jgi:ribonucrease Y
MPVALIITYLFVGLLLGLLIGGVVMLVLKKRRQEDAADAQAEADKLLKKAEASADGIRKEAQLEAREIENRAHEYEHDTRQRRMDLQKTEQRLIKKEENIERKGDLLTTKETEVQRREKQVAAKETDLARLAEEYERLTERAKETLVRVAGMSAEDAKAALISELVAEAKLEAAREIRTISEEAKEKAEEKAKQIISTALSRYAGEFVTEQVVSVISIPNEEMKGRIIGREGRNIRAFEAATGVDLIIDDTPEAVVVSGFSAVRREVARLSLEKLVSDGRIHPSRIEEVVKKTEQEVDQLIKQAGERATMEVNIYGLHPELVKLIGRLRYRTSYGQNVLAHSIEVSYMAGLLAGELKQNVKVARRAGLLHDIGKAADQEMEGPHHIVGAQLAKKYGESAQVVNAIHAHHEQPQTVLDHIIIASDALSGARPGARRELLESYLKRLEDLEKISKSFKGVEEAFAFQAGREIRVLVSPDQVDDAHLAILSQDIAKKIEAELTYPGRIKVAVIRQIRAESYAR